MQPVSLWLGIGAEHRLRALTELAVSEPEQYVNLAWSRLPRHIQTGFAEFAATDAEIQRLAQDDPTDVELEGYGGWPYPW